MVAVSAPMLIGYSLVLSAVLASLHGRGAAASGAGALTICALGLMLALWPSPRTIVSSPGFRLWALVVVVSTAAVWAVSRLALFSSRPWLLMILGPLSFVLVLLLTMITYNIIGNR